MLISFVVSISLAFSITDMHLAPFTTLRILRLATVIYPGHTLLWLVQSLREIVSGVGDGISNLEEISIHLEFRAIQSGIDIRLGLQVSLWNELDRLLTHSGKFSKLHRVYLCVSSPIGRRVSIEELFSRNYVPGLSRKGLLRMGYNTVWLDYPIEWREAAVGHD